MTDRPIAQQEFLRAAMSTLDMTPDEFAARIGSTTRCLDNWLLPSDAKGFRELDGVAWKFIREILEDQGKNA
ncbi:transcriptional regulator [Rugamonas sp. FT29W]|uniref:Transcriptional regulator n=2 Tax=Rugamonas aquatica TaxID=2743357 RepID=A0A6A7N646_9BURK|nr:transcriptional regulator [Rugamonas aquatica]